MDSNSHQKYQRHQFQPNSGLLRFRSAPSSLPANFSDSGVNNGNSSCERQESVRLVSRLVNYNNSNNTASRSFQEIEYKSPKASTEAAMNRMNLQQRLPPHYPRNSCATSSAMDGSYGLVDPETQKKSFSSNLLRQSSSPAGLFSNISFQKGYANVKGGGNYDRMKGSNGEVGLSTKRLKNQISFSSRCSSLGMLPEISEVESENTGASNGDPRYNSSRFPYGCWNEASHLSENLSGMKRERDDYKSLFSDNGEFKIRAKRGCATHPRSIAERVRRTRISERMRKLQKLVPNMDKQTNTADMLDLAVEYIKDLQRQYKTLSEKRASCRCINILNMQQQADTNHIV